MRNGSVVGKSFKSASVTDCITIWSLIFYSANRLWDIIRDTLIPSEAMELVEELGIEMDTQEHSRLESSDLCMPSGGSLKRKRA